LGVGISGMHGRGLILGVALSLLILPLEAFLIARLASRLKRREAIPDS
jgi:hypothetical protein